MLDLSTLNPPQREAVQTVEGPLLVLAGAGSGKTRVLTYRIANLIENHGVQPWRILALTFTNKAAAEMCERTEKLTGVSAKDMWVTTFHSFCARVLRYDIAELGGFTSRFTIYDDGDQNTVIGDIIKKLGLDEKRASKQYVRSLISKAKNSGANPEAFLRMTKDKTGSICEIYREYQYRLTASNALDFDDLLLKTVELFESCPEILAKYRARFSYMLVDEYQDTNHTQYEIIRLLTQESRNICVVGDDDQSIYGWRGANISNISNFTKDYPEAKVIQLEQNYRSTQQILDKANLLIRHNTRFAEKALWSERKGGKPVELRECEDPRDEAYSIGSIIAQKKRRGMSYNDFAVLYRTNAQSRSIESTLQQSFNIPISIIGGMRFYDRKEVKDILSYMQLVTNPSNDVAFKRIVNVPKRGIGDKSISELSYYAKSSDVPLFYAATTVGLLPETLHKKIEPFTKVMADIIAVQKEKTLGEFVQFIIDRIGYTEYLEDLQDGLLEARLENISELINGAQEHERDNAGTDGDPLISYLENAALLSSIDDDYEHGTVKLMTIHCAKGLEFPVVFIAGMEENLFPSTRSDEGDSRIEEERRLCYVGVTRAENELYLLSCKSRMLYGQTTKNIIPSRFLSEMELVHNNDYNHLQNTYRNSSGFFSSNRGTYSERKSSSIQHPKKADQTTSVINQPSKSNTLSFVFGKKEPSTDAYTAEPVKKHDASVYKKYQRVIHDKFGRGVITEVSGSGNTATITVDFEKVGVKRLAAAYVVMKLAEDDNE
ncbi:MAG: UvrD-helicase domain-containing protein [Clostridiales bacterium]|nr:UvrD-helicase domain-containing protein [Clostridiales bacterium]